MKKIIGLLGLTAMAGGLMLGLSGKKAEAEEAAKKAQEEPKKESGQESYSVENLQTPATDSDWGNLLNSF